MSNDEELSAARRLATCEAVEKEIRNKKSSAQESLEDRFAMREDLVARGYSERQAEALLNRRGYPKPPVKNSSMFVALAGVVAIVITTPLFFMFAPPSEGLFGWVIWCAIVFYGLHLAYRWRWDAYARKERPEGEDDVYPRV